VLRHHELELVGCYVHSAEKHGVDVGSLIGAEVRSTLDLAVATSPIDSPIGEIEPGRVAGQRFGWEALVRDQVVVRVAVAWLMGREHLEPAWDFGPEVRTYLDLPLSRAGRTRA
jgi:hypothetical protein